MIISSLINFLLDRFIFIIFFLSQNRIDTNEHHLKMATIIKAHEIQTINFTSLKKEVSLNKMVNNKTIVTQDTGHQTSRAEAKC